MDLLNCLRISWLRDRKIAKRLLQRYQAKRSVRNLQWVCLKDPKQVKSPAKRSIRDRGGFSLTLQHSITKVMTAIQAQFVPGGSRTTCASTLVERGGEFENEIENRV